MTQWRFELDRQAAAAGAAWVRAFAADYDLSLLESITLQRGRSTKAVGVYGKCYFPTQTRPLYRITCMLPGPFPCHIHIRKPPVYMNEDGSFPRIPQGCRRGVHCIDRRTGKQWHRIIGQTHLADLSEGVVWIFAHEMFHYLRRTRQIPGRNNEIQADAYGDALLAQFRVERQGRRVVHEKTPEPPRRMVTPSGKQPLPKQPLPKLPPTPTVVEQLGNAIRSWMGLWAQPPGKSTGRASGSQPKRGRRNA